MSRIFVTGSADGLGLLAAQLLVQQGHQVVLHARNSERAKVALAGVPQADAVVVGDLSSITETKKIAEEVNKLGFFDAVIHNAGAGYRESYHKTSDKVPALLAVNTLAPYILTCLIQKPERLIYLSSGLHRQGDSSLEDLAWQHKPWDGFKAYCDTKLHDAMLAFAAARIWPDVYSNAVEPGWVATKMGGPSATDSLEEGFKTQAWLAVSKEPAALVSGKYFFHRQLHTVHPAVSNIILQQKLLDACKSLTGINFPG